MSIEQPESRSSSDNDPLSAPVDPGLDEESYTNLFASVWVKTELNEEDEVQIKQEPVDQTEKTIRQKRGRKPGKKQYTQPEKLKCDQCDYTTYVKNAFSIHMSRHTGEKPFSCTQCNYKAKYLVSLKHHIIKKHEHKTKDELPTYNCTVCSYKTPFEWNLTAHKRKHNQTYQCPKCSFSAGSKYNFMKHSRTHEETLYNCDKCPFTTKFEGHITRHLAKLHFEVSNTAIRCQFCSFSTKTGWRLNTHKKRSCQDKAIKCVHCDYETMYRCAFKEHRLTHTEFIKYNQQRLHTIFTDNNQQIQQDTKEQSLEIMQLCEMRSMDQEDAGKGHNESTKIYNDLKNNLNNETTYYTIKNRQVPTLLTDNNQQIQQDTTEQSLEIMKMCEMRSKDREDAGKDHNESTKIYNDLKNKLNEDTTYYTIHNRQVPTLLTDNNQQIQQDTTEQSLEIMKMCEMRSKDQEDAGKDHNESTKIYNNLKNKLNEDTTYYTINNDNQVPSLTQTSEQNNSYYVDPDFKSSWKSIKVIESPNQDLPFQCITCNYKSKFKASVQTHYLRHHSSKNRPYKCVHCDFSTKTKVQINLHNRRSKSDEILICKICAFTSVFKCQFVMHEKAHYPFKCVHCEYTCKNKVDIQKHFTIVHLGNGLKCSYCDYKALRKESLLCHEVIHTGKKPFQCELCQYSSVRKSLLERHMIRFHNKRVAEKIIDYSKIKSLKDS